MSKLFYDVIVSNRFFSIAILNILFNVDNLERSEILTFARIISRSEFRDISISFSQFGVKLILVFIRLFFLQCTFWVENVFDIYVIEIVFYCRVLYVFFRYDLSVKISVFGYELSVKIFIRDWFKFLLFYQLVLFFYQLVLFFYELVLFFQRLVFGYC